MPLPPIGVSALQQRWPTAHTILGGADRAARLLTAIWAGVAVLGWL